MSIIKQALNSPAAMAYYAAAEELFDGVKPTDGTVRRYVEGWKASEQYQAAAFSAYVEMHNAFLAALAELGGFAKQAEDEDQLTYRIACELIHGKMSQGTRDTLEFNQFLLGIKECQERDAAAAKAAGYDFD